jgi:uncharacterized protein (DUF934 family)
MFMPKLINRDGILVVGDAWITYTGDAHAIPAGSKVLLPLTEFREFVSTWRKHANALGVLLSSSDDVAQIANDLAHLELIAIDFPSFVDGRGYSIAHTLRHRYGWRGELRAIGDIQRDQVFLLARAGFDSFALRSDQNEVQAIEALDDFSIAYQWGADRFGARRSIQVDRRV